LHPQRVERSDNANVERIAVATDFSENAEAAVTRAAQLALEHDAHLILLHALGEPAIEVARLMYGAGRSPLQETLRHSAEEQARAVVESLDARLQERTTVRIVSGRPFAAILEALKEQAADVLVMGAHGEHSHLTFWLGSTTERVLHKAPCPTLAVKRKASAAYRRLLVPVDLSPNSVPAVELALRFSPEAEITAVHAYHVPFESKLRLSGATADTIDGYREQVRSEARQGLNKLLEQVPGAEGRVKTALVFGDAVPVILEQEKLLEADLIVLGRQGRSMLGETLLGRVTRRALADSSADVLVSCFRGD